MTQVFVTESSLKIMKSAFYFTFKSPFVLKIIQFLSWLVSHVEKPAWLEVLEVWGD